MAGLGAYAYNTLGWRQRRHDRRRLRLPVHADGGLRGRVLRARRQDQERHLAAARRGGLHLLHRPDPGRRRRLLSSRRRHRHGGVREAVQPAQGRSGATRSSAASSRSTRACSPTRTSARAWWASSRAPRPTRTRRRPNTRSTSRRSRTAGPTRRRADRPGRQGALRCQLGERRRGDRAGARGRSTAISRTAARPTARRCSRSATTASTSVEGPIKLDENRQAIGNNYSSRRRSRTTARSSTRR